MTRKESKTSKSEYDSISFEDVGPAGGRASAQNTISWKSS